MDKEQLEEIVEEAVIDDENGLEKDEVQDKVEEGE